MMLKVVWWAFRAEHHISCQACPRFLDTVFDALMVLSTMDRAVSGKAVLKRVTPISLPSRNGGGGCSCGQISV